MIPATFTVVLDAPMVERITEWCAATPGVETGGLLILHGDHGYASGPGPGAVCAARALEFDTAYIAGVAETAVGLGAEILGRWHKHPNPIILASEDDRTSADLFRRALGLESFVDVIVGCDRNAPIGWSAYLCSEGEYRRVHLEVPTGAVV